MHNILLPVDIHVSPSQISWLLALGHTKEMDSMEIWKKKKILFLVTTSNV